MACLGFTGCGLHPVKSAPSTEAPAPVAPAPKPTYKPFEANTFYSLLVAEVAGSRQRYDILLSNYVQQAQLTRDPEIVAHATQIARRLNMGDVALRMSLLWVEVAPDKIEAHQAALVELARANRISEAFAQGQYLLQRGSESGLDILAAQVTQIGAGPAAPSGRTPLPENQSALMLPLYQGLLAQHPKAPALLLGTSYLLLHEGQKAEALTLANQAVAIKPDDVNALMQQARLLQVLGRGAEGQAKIQRLLDLQPDNTRLRLYYAKGLAAQNLPAAQAQFEILLKQAPQDPDLNMAMALVLIEQKKLPEAQAYLIKLFDDPSHGSAAHYYAGRIAQQMKQIPEAMEHYRQVNAGNELLPALAQYTQLLSSQGRAQDALDRLRSQAPLAQGAQVGGIHLLEANLLADLQRYLEAEAVLNQLLQQHPDATQVLYARSLLYTRLGRNAEAEADLRRIIKIEPKNSVALNALGYGLSSQPDRLAEAADYVQQALLLSPDEPAIMDSLGWIYFHQGKRREAIKLLRTAFDRMPDPEIGTHLGEALWVAGDTEEARKIWRQCLELRPGSLVVRETLNRLSVTLD